MQFCPKCQSLLVPYKLGQKTRLKCSNCNYIMKERSNLVMKEKIPPSEKIEVVDKKLEILPKTDAECPKCSNKNAYYWQIQTRSSDEAETTFYKCTKCDHTWRAY